eukprot:5781144-Pyramimonas_sp.AAC.1
MGEALHLRHGAGAGGDARGEHVRPGLGELRGEEAVLLERGARDEQRHVRLQRVLLQRLVLLLRLRGVVRARPQPVEHAVRHLPSANMAGVKGDRVDAKGYMVDVKGYSADAKGYMVDVKGYSAEAKGYMDPRSSQKKGTSSLQGTTNAVVYLGADAARVAAWLTRSTAPTVSILTDCVAYLGADAARVADGGRLVDAQHGVVRVDARPKLRHPQHAGVAHQRARAPLPRRHGRAPRAQLGRR